MSKIRDKAHEFLMRKGVKSIGNTFTAHTIEEWLVEFGYIIKDNKSLSHKPTPVLCKCGGKLTDKELFYGQCLECGEYIEE